MGYIIGDASGYETLFGEFAGKALVHIDTGHGSWRNGFSGEKVEDYLTFPNKCFDHSVWPNFSSKFYHINGWFMEGVWNDMMGELIIDYLSKRGVITVRTSKHCEDTPLRDRTEYANKVYYSAPDLMHLLLSIHANASKSHNAWGSEIYTSYGLTDSDPAAHIVFDEWASSGVRVKMRLDYTTKEKDKEAAFWMLRKTAMPAILLEFDFFDNKIGVENLMNPEWCKAMAEATGRGIIKYFKWKTNYLAA